MGRRTQENKARGGASGARRERGRALQGPVLRYAARFLFLTAGLFGLSLLGPFQALATGCTHGCAWLANAVLWSLGQGTRLSGSEIHSTRFGVTVLGACTGGELIAFLWAGILAFPASVRARALGVLSGTVLLLALNVLRIVCVFLVGVYAPRLFQTIHEELWPSVLVLVTLGLGFAWMRRADRGTFGGDPALKGRLRRCAVVFAVLILPWPGLANACGRALRGLGNSAFTTPVGSREVTFERQGVDGTRIEIVNRDLMRPDGSGPVRDLDFQTLGFAWRPLCLLLALILATPMGLRGRLRMAGAGALALLVYMLLTLDYAIWNESTEVALNTLGPTWKLIAADAQDFLIGRIGLAVPAVIWMGAVGWNAGWLKWDGAGLPTGSGPHRLGA